MSTETWGLDDRLSDAKNRDLNQIGKHDTSSAHSNPTDEAGPIERDAGSIVSSEIGWDEMEYDDGMGGLSSLDFLLGDGHAKENPNITARALHSKEIYNKKASIFRQTICIPKLWLYKTLALGGWKLFIVYLYLLINQTKFYTLTTNVQMICEWVGITRKKLETVMGYLDILASESIIGYRYKGARTVTTTLNISVNPPRYPYTYIYIAHENLKVMKELKWYREFVIYCYLEASIPYEKDENGHISQDRHCMVSQETLARRLRLSRNTVHNCLKNLNNERLIHIEKLYNKNTHKYNCSIYTLLDYKSSYWHLCKDNKLIWDKLEQLNLPIMRRDNPFLKTMHTIMSLKESEYPVIAYGIGAKLIWEYAQKHQAFQGSDFKFDTFLIGKDNREEFFYFKPGIRVMATRYYSNISVTAQDVQRDCIILFPRSEVSGKMRSATGYTIFSRDEDALKYLDIGGFTLINGKGEKIRSVRH